MELKEPLVKTGKNRVLFNAERIVMQRIASFFFWKTKNKDEKKNEESEHSGEDIRRAGKLCRNYFNKTRFVISFHLEFSCVFSSEFCCCFVHRNHMAFTVIYTLTHSLLFQVLYSLLSFFFHNENLCCRNSVYIVVRGTSTNLYCVSWTW